MMIVENRAWESYLNTFYPLIPEDQLQYLAKQFKREIIGALSNQRSSLPAILNPVHRMLPKPGFGIAASIGGTNGYVSAFRISKKGEISFQNKIFFTIPLKTNKNELFHLITKHVLSSIKNRKSFSVGVDFAYPLKPVLNNGLIDGELVSMTKGREIKGLVGKQVGQEYHQFLKKEYSIDATVNIVNDTVALLLGGDSADIAGIVGTG